MDNPKGAIPSKQQEEFRKTMNLRAKIPTNSRYLVGNGRGRPSKKKPEILYLGGPKSNLTKIVHLLYQCPLCEDGNGAITGPVEMVDHFLEDHAEQETKDDFLREVRDFMEEEFAFIRGLLHK